LIGIIFCSFYYDALTFSANFDLSLVFFTFLSESFDVLTALFVCKYQGFVSAVSIMRDFVPAIYDTTVVIPKESPAPTMLRILKGQSSVVHVRIKRHAMSDMPESDEDVSKWCKDIFVAKDALLDKHIATGGSVLVMPPAIWCLQILTVDSAPVNMERHYPLCCWIGAGDWHHACLHHVLAVRALELCQSSEESS